MKKFITTLLVAFLCFSMTACSCGKSSDSYSKIKGSYFLDNPNLMGVGDVNETCTYSLSIKPYQSAKITAEDISGFYRVNLADTTYDVGGEEVNCYKLTAIFEMTGKYVYKGTIIPIDDSFKVDVYFYGADKNLKPIHTEKTMKSTSAYVLTDKVEINTIEYSYSIDYTDTHANVSFTEVSDVFNLPEAFSKELPSNFIENELLLLYPRLFNLKDGYNVKQSTFVAVQNQNIKLATNRISTGTSVEMTYEHLGRTYNSIKLDCISLCQNSTYSGPLLYGYYSTLDGSSFNNAILFKIESGIDQVGQLVYTLTNYERG